MEGVEGVFCLSEVEDDEREVVVVVVVVAVLVLVAVVAPPTLILVVTVEGVPSGGLFDSSCLPALDIDDDPDMIYQAGWELTRRSRSAVKEQGGNKSWGLEG